MKKIISGGQTGADRAALEWAVKNGIAAGGWCPQGRRAEDGKVPARYGLQETPSRRWSQRTEWNVRDSEGTVVFSLNKRLVGGSLLTTKWARHYGKPCLHLHKKSFDPAAQLKEFVRTEGIRILNIAGSRASQEKGIGRFVKRILRDAFQESVLFTRNS